MNRRPNTSALSLMAMALSLGMMPPTAYQTRQDPDREKTPGGLGASVQSRRETPSESGQTQ